MSVTFQSKGDLERHHAFNLTICVTLGRGNMSLIASHKCLEMRQELRPLYKFEASRRKKTQTYYDFNNDNETRRHV